MRLFLMQLQAHLRPEVVRSMSQGHERASFESVITSYFSCVIVA